MRDGAAHAMIWTCPMHPEVRNPGPGSCPYCGMALEPEQPAAEGIANPELTGFTRRLWVSVTLIVPLLAVSMLPEMLGIHVLPMAMSSWVQCALAAPVVLWAGKPFFERGAASLRSGHLNMFTLIALGVGAAFLYSVVATIAPGIFPADFRIHGTVPVYYESAGVVVALVLLGQILELRARAATGRAIRALLDLTPKTAHRIDATGTESEVPVAQLVRGDLLAIRDRKSVV